MTLVPSPRGLLERARGLVFGSQLRRNVFSGVASMAATLGILVVSYPAYLRYLGYEKYGIWLALSTVLTFAQLGNLGIGQAITKYVAEEHAKGDRASVEAYSSTAIAILVFVGALIVLGGVIAQRPIVALFRLAPEAEAAMLAALPAVALLSAYVIVLQVYIGALGGLGAMERSNYVQVVGRVLTLAVSIGGLAAGQGLTAMVTGSFAGYLLVHAWISVSMRRDFGVRAFRPGAVSVAAARVLIRYGGGVLGSSLLNLALHPINRVIISRFAGVASLPLFEIAYTGSMQIRAFLDGAVRPLMPEFSKVLAQSDRREAFVRVSALDRRASRLVWTLGAPTYAACFLLAPFALHLWLGARYLPIQAPLFRIMLVGSFFNALALPGYYLLLGAGRVRLVFIAHLLQTAANLGLQLGTVAVTGALSLRWAVGCVSTAFAISMVYLHVARRVWLRDQFANVPVS